MAATTERSPPVTARHTRQHGSPDFPQPAKPLQSESGSLSLCCAEGTSELKVCRAGSGLTNQYATMRRADVLRAGRAEEISTKARMAYRTVADDIDERGLARLQCMFKGRAKLLRSLDVFTVAIHELEHPVVALVR